MSTPAKIEPLLERLDNVDTATIPVKSFRDIIAEQKKLLEHYTTKNSSCANIDFMCQQLVLAVIDEAAEYHGWLKEGNLVEAMFEAIDMYHFAAEGLIILEPGVVDYTPRKCNYAKTEYDIIMSCSAILNNSNWKHWKKPKTQYRAPAYAAFCTLCDIAYTMFIRLYEIEYGTRLQTTLHGEFFKFYYVKNQENYDRQQRGY